MAEELVITGEHAFSPSSNPTSSHPQFSASRTNLSITSLPLEIVTAILQFACEDLKYYSEKEFLLSACLISRNVWHREAQRMLWVEVAVHERHTARALQESAVFGQYTTRTLRISRGGKNPVSARDASRIVGGLQGVDRLSMSGFESWLPDSGLTADCLMGENLKNVRFLDLSNVYFRSPESDPSTIELFPALLNLHLSHCNYGSELRLAALFASSRLQTLTLAAEELSVSQHEDVLHLWRSIAPTLSHLYFRVRNATLPVESFARCFNLESLGLGVPSADLVTILQLIPSRLKSLSVLTCDNELANRLHEAFLECGSLSKLTWIHLPNGVGWLDGFRHQLLPLFKERGIEYPY